MDKEKINKIFAYLVESTKDDTLVWKEGRETNSFVLDFPNSSVRVEYQKAPRVTLINEDGSAIIVITTESAPSYAIQPENLFDLFYLVRSKVFKVEKTLDDLLKNLETPF
ncbi:hypothetical protein OKA05_02950 [Luteolibacter arcticus]|uniref:Immunity protein 53 n=1 Tax=Luteolibacter arcticus TaxID=1581411 RepID=A0ABT3GD00_9BACT|nr:hypothetical protein [Luteolibacter arcticus]MCW1921494.1 hypothetical protein [Luteolibacter arcticus]